MTVSEYIRLYGEGKVGSEMLLALRTDEGYRVFAEGVFDIRAFYDSRFKRKRFVSSGHGFRKRGSVRRFHVSAEYRDNALCNALLSETEFDYMYISAKTGRGESGRVTADVSCEGDASGMLMETELYSMGEAERI